MDADAAVRLVRATLAETVADGAGSGGDAGEEDGDARGPALSILRPLLEDGDDDEKDAEEEEDENGAEGAAGGGRGGKGGGRGSGASVKRTRAPNRPAAAALRKPPPAGAKRARVEPPRPAAGTARRTADPDAATADTTDPFAFTDGPPGAPTAPAEATLAASVSAFRKRVWAALSGLPTGASVALPALMRRLDPLPRGAAELTTAAAREEIAKWNAEADCPVVFAPADDAVSLL